MIIRLIVLGIFAPNGSWRVSFRPDGSMASVLAVGQCLSSPSPSVTSSKASSAVSVAPGVEIVVIRIAKAPHTPHGPAYLAIAEHVHPVLHMEQAVAANAVVLGVTATVIVHDSTEIALLTEDVIELAHHRQRFTSQESVTDLCCPYQFVGVHGGLIESASAILMDIGGNARAPRQAHIDVGTVSETPCVHVVCRHQGILAVVVIERAIKFYLKPLVAISCRQPLPPCGCRGDVFL